MRLHGHNSLSDAVTSMEAIDRDSLTARIQRNALSRMFQFRDCLQDLKETLCEIEPDEERVCCHIRLINVLQKWTPSIEDLLKEIEPDWRELLSDESLQRLKQKVQQATG